MTPPWKNGEGYETVAFEFDEAFSAKTRDSRMLLLLVNCTGLGQGKEGVRVALFQKDLFLLTDFLVRPTILVASFIHFLLTNSISTYKCEGWKCFSFNFSKSKTSQAGWIVNLSYYYALWKGKHGIPCNPQMIYSPHTLFGCIWRRLANWLVVNRIMQWLKPQGSFFFLIWWRHSQQPYVNSLCYFMNKNIKNQCQWKMREFPPTWCKTSYCHLLRKCMLRYENWVWKNC